MSYTQYVAFNLGSDVYAISILNVQEIINPLEPVKLPEAPEYILGVIDFRQKVIPVIDLKKRLLIQENGNQGAKKIIIVNTKDMTLGGLVDDIVGVIDVKDEEVKKEMGALNYELKDYIKGFVKYNDNLIKLLDFSYILSSDDISLLKEKVSSSDVPDSVENIDESNLPQLCKQYFVDQMNNKFISKVKNEEDAKAMIEFTNYIQKFIDAVVNGEIEDAENVLREMAHYGEEQPLKEISEISKLLQNSLNEFKKLAVISDVPEAKDDLQWVINKTEEAVTNTIKIIEKNLNVQSDIVKRLDIIENALNRVADLTDDEKEAMQFLRKTAEEINADLMEMILIQEYQDLTGQILKKVINLATTLEKELKNIIEMFAKKEPKKKEEVVKGQSDVDDLLKEFGM